MPRRQAGRTGEAETPGAGIAANGEDPPSGDDSFDGLLAAISDDVQCRAATARHGVIVDFAARVRHARKHLSHSLVSAAIASIAQARKAALAAISQNAAAELAGRRKMAAAQFRKSGRPSKPLQGRSKPPHADPTV